MHFIYTELQMFTPMFYGSDLLDYIYGFWITLLLCGACILYLFQKITKIKMPLWIYLTSYLIFPFRRTYLFLLLPIIFSLLIYFFVTKRQISFSYILTNMLFDIGIFYSVTAVLGLIIVASVQSITPTYATPILNSGGPIVYLIEIITTMPIIKKIQPALNYYSKTVLVQAPVLVWLFNLFLFFRIFLGINYINPIIKVSAPVHMLNGLLYVIIIVLFTQVTAKFYRYKNLTTSQGAELTNLQAYTSHIETMYDDLRRFRHDYKNVLLSLEGAVSSGDIKEVQDIFQRVVKPTNTNLDDQTAVLSHLENIKNIEIKSLVYNKVMTAINDHIDVSVEVVEPFKISPKVKVTDAVRIIAILFDNAINAAKKAPTKEINFSLFTKGSAQYIIIRNSTTEEKVDLHMLDGNFKGISSERHSLGLRNLRIILASYSFIQHNSQSGNHSVTQEIIIH